MSQNIYNEVKKIFEQNGVLIYEEEGIEKLELDSLQFVSSIADLETQFNILIPDELLNDENLNSMQDFCKIIEKLVKD